MATTLYGRAQVIEKSDARRAVCEMLFNSLTTQVIQAAVEEFR